jgi:outer membrane protein assembly factor BamA
MKRVFIFLALFAGFSAGLSPQELPEGGNRITAISVTGLKRTKPRIIEKPLQKFTGRDAGSLDINEVYAAVESTGILETKSVEILDNQTGNGKTLVVTVREKWSVFPVPLAFVNSGGWAVGAAFADTNAFGIKDTMVIMGLFGAGGITTSIMYLHPPAGSGEFGLNVAPFFSIQENELTGQTGEQTLRRYNAMSIHPSAEVLYQLTELVTAGFGLSYTNVILRDTENPLNAPEYGTQGITLSPNIGILHNSWDGYFL